MTENAFAEFPQQLRERLGLRVRKARQDANMTQKQLGLKMKDLGFKWCQVTVSDSERGERPISWTEMMMLRIVLGNDLGIQLTEFDDG